jgi:hypothetical protein
LPLSRQAKPDSDVSYKGETMGLFGKSKKESTPDKAELTAVFTQLGAADPDEWAESEIAEGIPQLARFLFLKGCWDQIESDGDTQWIENTITNIPEGSSDPFAGTAHALRRLLAAGAAPEDITEVVRGVQAELLSGICYQLDDSDSVTGNDFVSWGLFELDENEQPKRAIGGLHESVLETDPTGREMCPKEESS